VVFPPFYFGQIYEARCFPGTITVAPGLLLELLQSALDEIGRNGFKKIILFNAHGGNTHFLRFLAQAQLWKQKPYTLYMPTQGMSPEDEATWLAMRSTDYGGHACEEETSMVLGIHPELVKMDRVPNLPARPLGRFAPLPPTYTGSWWYADYPDHYAGDARSATREKGEFLIKAMADNLAKYIAAVKADTIVPALESDFFNR
jgi:creatinine amidohydrolase